MRIHGILPINDNTPKREGLSAVALSFHIPNPTGSSALGKILSDKLKYPRVGNLALLVAEPAAQNNGDSYLWQVKKMPPTSYRMVPNYVQDTGIEVKLQKTT